MYAIDLFKIAFRFTFWPLKVTGIQSLLYAVCPRVRELSPGVKEATKVSLICVRGQSALVCGAAPAAAAPPCHAVLDFAGHLPPEANI